MGGQRRMIREDKRTEEEDRRRADQAEEMRMIGEDNRGEER